MNKDGNLKIEMFDSVNLSYLQESINKWLRTHPCEVRNITYHPLVTIASESNEDITHVAMIVYHNSCYSNKND